MRPREAEDPKNVTDQDAVCFIPLLHLPSCLVFKDNEWQARWSPAQDLSILPDAADAFQY
jgi:hypothetical protein